MSLPVQVMGPEEGPFPQIIKALLLDDSTFDRARIRRMSHKTQLALQLTEVGSIQELEEAVAHEAYDLIMIDYRLPQGDGLSVLNHIQNTPLNKDVATIMITGDGDMETAVTAMRNGCHDFLTKDAMTPEHLRFAMTNAMTTAAEHRDLVAQSEHQRKIITKGLTAALMDEEVQGKVVALFKDEFDTALSRHAQIFSPHDHSALDAMLATVDEDDEFIFI